MLWIIKDINKISQLKKNHCKYIKVYENIRFTPVFQKQLTKELWVQSLPGETTSCLLHRQGCFCLDLGPRSFSLVWQDLKAFLNYSITYTYKFVCTPFCEQTLLVCVFKTILYYCVSQIWVEKYNLRNFAWISFF